MDKTKRITTADRFNKISEEHKYSGVIQSLQTWTDDMRKLYAMIIDVGYEQALKGKSHFEYVINEETRESETFVRLPEIIEYLATMDQFKVSATVKRTSVYVYTPRLGDIGLGYEATIEVSW